MKSRKLLENAGRPHSLFFAKPMLDRMNENHNEGELWGIDKLDLKKAKEIIDIGCGGGRNIDNFLNLTKDAKVTGIDHSKVSVKKSIAYNKKAVKEKRAEIFAADINTYDFEDKKFDVATAFETVYFWDDIEKSFENIYNMLNEKGQFLVCNEVSKREQFEEWGEYEKMHFYSSTDLEKLMKKVGFTYVEKFHRSDEHWIAVIGRK